MEELRSCKARGVIINPLLSVCGGGRFIFNPLLSVVILLEI